MVTDKPGGAVHTDAYTRCLGHIEADENAQAQRQAPRIGDACAEVAQRLSQRGLSSEAIPLAESEPKLLDSPAVLDFPERPDWDDLGQMGELAPAPRIPLELARRLNESYAEEELLQELLRCHRLLALQRAPLRLRIAVLRQLVDQDPSNPIWPEDLRGFEQVRLLQVQDEATKALRRDDPEWIGRLVREVERPDWTNLPPQALVLSLRKANAQIQGERARARLSDVADRLEAARTAEDPVRGRLARQEWCRLATAAALATDDPIADRAQPALDWLDEQDRRARENREHEEAIGYLVGALEYPGSLDPAELERLAHAVQARGDGLPEGLRRRYITRLCAAETAQRRRQRRIAAGSAAGILLAGTLIYLGVHAHTRAQQAERAATSISDLLELNELDHAVAMLKDCEKDDPDLMRYPALIDVHWRVEIAQGQEADRALQFDQAMREAGAAPASAEPPPALERARSLARLDTEKAALDKLVRLRAEMLQAEQDRLEKELAPRLDEIAGAVGRIETQLEPGGPGCPKVPALLGSIADSRRALSDLAPDVAMAGASIRDRARTLSDRFDAIRSRVERRGQQAQREDAITASVAYAPDGRGFTSPGELASALEAFARAFPDSPRSKAFTETLLDQPIWDAIAEWDRMTAGWRGGTEAIAPPEATVRAEKCRQFAVRCPTSPDLDRSTAYHQVMEAMAHRSADGEGALCKLQMLMTDLLVENVWLVTVRVPAPDDLRVIVTQRGRGMGLVVVRVPGPVGLRHYYATEQPPRGAESLRYLVGSDGKERTLKVAGDRVERIEVSPQTKIAQKFKPILLQDPTRIDWEVVILDLVEQVRTQPGMDPVLRVALLRKVLEFGLEGSDPLQRALRRFKDQVSQAGVDVSVPWMDPESREADQVRPKALELVRSLPELGALRKDALARRAAVRRLLSGHPQAVGWLAREPEGWRVRTGAALPPQGELRVAVAGDYVHGAWKTVGVIDQGRPRLTAPDDPALAEGRPVFVVSADSAR
jgi:hypothetical protein